MSCDRCGTPAIAGAEYCGACGAHLRPRPEVVAAAMASARRREQWAVWAFAAVALVVVIELIVGVAQISPERRAHRASASLHATSATLDKTKKDLGVRTKERDELYAKANRVSGELDDAKKSITFQGTQLQTFKDCLGTIKALVIADDAGNTAAVPALIQKANRACDAADRLL